MFFSKALAFVSIAAGFSTITALSLSSQCQSTLTSIVVSSDAQCLNAQALVGIVVAGSDTSLVEPINSWLTGMCAQPVCTNATLATIVQNVTSGCQTELNNYGLGNVTAEQLTTVVEMAYPTVRQVACLQNTNTNTLCITETLTNFQNATGQPLSTNEVGNLVSGSGNITSISPTIACTDCNKQSYNIIKAQFGDLIPSDTQSAISSTCGASFVDGSNPSGIRQTATNSNTSAAASNNGDIAALGANALGPISSILAAIAFVFFA